LPKEGNNKKMEEKYHFASDNTAGICPEAWAALAEANSGFAASYGNDDYTAQAESRFRELFETDCEVYFVFNGTAANSLALAALCQPYHSVITHADAHVEADECNAPQFFSGGVKLIALAGDDGKLGAESIERAIIERDDVHFAKPRAVSLTLPTEHGTLYSLDEIGAISGVVKKHGLKLHVDGARFANAIAASGATPAELSWKAGADVLCCGGVKNGMGISEAVVFFDKALSAEFAYRRKQAGQLASKTRFMAAPWAAMLKDGTWTRHAQHANACAKRLAQKLAGVPGVTIKYPVDVNAVFAEMPEAMHAKLEQAGWHYYRFFGGNARFMCSWATTDAMVDALAADISAAA
jgi:threonine aldolase